MTHTRVIFKLNYWFVFIGCFEVIYHVRNLLERKKNCPPLQQQQQNWTTFWFEKKLHSYWPIMLYYLSCTECSIRIRWILKALYFISANLHSRPHLHLALLYPIYNNAYSTVTSENQSSFFCARNVLTFFVRFIFCAQNVLTFFVRFIFVHKMSPLYGHNQAESRPKADISASYE